MLKMLLLCASKLDTLKMETIQCAHAVLKNVPLINIKLLFIRNVNEENKQGSLDILKNWSLNRKRKQEAKIIPNCMNIADLSCPWNLFIGLTLHDSSSAKDMHFIC